MNKKQKMVILCFIIFLMIITILTFTKIDIRVSEMLGLGLRGIYTSKGFYRIHRIHPGREYDIQPQMNAFVAYCFIGFVINLGAIKIFEDRQ